MRKQTPPKRIVAALWLSNASGRDLLSGIFRFARERKHWQITLLQLPNGFSPVLLDQIRKSGTDGIITSDHGNPTVMTLVAEELCTRAVTPAPARIAKSRFRVM